jgi:hypothetical protein
LQLPFICGRECQGVLDVILIALAILEDLAGDRIGRPFEADIFERVDTTTAPERFTRPFTVRE